MKMSERGGRLYMLKLYFVLGICIILGGNIDGQSVSCSDYDKLLHVMSGGHADLNAEKQADQYSKALKNKIKNMKCVKGCGIFDNNFRSEVAELGGILASLGAIDNIRLNNTFDNLLKVFKDIRPQFSSDNFFDHVVTQTIGRRPNSGHLFPSSSQLEEKRHSARREPNMGRKEAKKERRDSKMYSKHKNTVGKDSSQFWNVPEMFRRVDPKLFRASAFPKEKEKPEEIEKGFRGFARYHNYSYDTEYITGAEGSEQLLDYFREDNGIHNAHQDWHSQSKVKQPIMRHGERFVFFHRQILHRYLIERKVLGLDDVKPLDVKSLANGFRTQYTWYYAPLIVSNNKENCSLNSTQVEHVRDVEEDLEDAEHYWKFLTILEHDYHDWIHNTISAHCRANEKKDGYFDDARYSARDPLFFRLHTQIEKYISMFQGKPYNWRDLMPAAGIQVEKFELKSRCRTKNLVETFYRQSEFQLGLKQVLDHEDFTLKIWIKNNLRQQKKVVCRLFIGLLDMYNSGSYHIEMDRWVQQLSGDEEDVIDRKSMSNALTNLRNKNTPCAWPHNLLLPRGIENKMVPFRMVLFVHDPLPNQKVNEGENRSKQPFMLCGFPNSTRNVYMDERKFGFPLNSDWVDFNKREVLTNQIPYFGNISTIINIWFSRARKNNCGQ